MKRKHVQTKKARSNEESTFGNKKGLFAASARHTMLRYSTSLAFTVFSSVFNMARKYQFCCWLKRKSYNIF